MRTMGSRLRENPEKIFEVFLEIAKPENEDTIFIQKYPQDYNDELVLKPLPKFAFPCDSERTKVDHFTFVLTDLESKYKFGYCRHAQGVQTCLCIVSCLPWFDVFYTILNKLAEMNNTNESENNVTELLRATYANGVPTPGVPVQIIVGQDMLNFTAPDTSKLPSIPSNRNLTEYYSAVDTENMMKVFASMLHERRILFISKKLSRLTACVHASTCLLYPMHWQHLFIPILPPSLSDYVTAPMPYVIGIHTSVYEKIRANELADAVVLDVDNNVLTTEYDDFEDLPSEISSYLKRHLKKDKVITQMSTSGDVIPKAFMQSLVRLIGGYRDALRFHPGEPITFDPEAFVQSRPSSMQPFLEQMFELQIFQQFINDRLDLLNLGKGFSDIFEMEAMLQADKLNSNSRYREWLTNMKKQGKQLQKNSNKYFKVFRDKLQEIDFSYGHKHIYHVATKVGNASKEFSQRHIQNMASKAAPVVSSAMHTMKQEGKKLYTGVVKQVQDIRQDMKKDDDHIRTKSMKQPRSDSKALTRNRPATVIHGEVLIPIRPLRPGTQPAITVSPSDRVSKYKVINITDEHSVDDSEAELSYNRVSLNLLADLDIQAALKKSKSVSAEDLGTSPINHCILEESDVSSIDSYNITDRASPALLEKSKVAYEEETSSVSSTSTFDSANIPYIDTSDDAGKHPIAPPRRNRRQKQTEDVQDRLIGGRKPPHEKPSGPKSSQRPSQPPPPRPAPRRSLSKDQPSKELSIVPLIELDSPENNDVFDPFSSKNSSTVGRVEFFSSPENSPFGKGNILENFDDKKCELIRTPAFRKTASETPLRECFKPDNSPLSSCSGSSTMDSSGVLFASFDPLVSDGLNISESSEPDTSSQNTDLFQDWTINNIKTVSRINTSSQILARGNNLPGCREPVGVASNPLYGTGVPFRQSPSPSSKPCIPPRPKTVFGNSVRYHTSKPTVVANPIFAINNSKSTNSTVEVSGRNSDPFSDLHDISVTNRKSQELAQSKWEKFES